MPQLRQVAIAANDPSKLAAFYHDVFELEVIGEASTMSCAIPTATESVCCRAPLTRLTSKLRCRSAMWRCSRPIRNAWRIFIASCSI